MNAIPNNIPRTMRNSYMWALEYGSLTHNLPKNLAKKLMQYGNASRIYKRAQETRKTINTYPNLSYNDAFVLSHVIGNDIPRRIINGYMSLKRRGMSSENAAMAIAADPSLGRKHDASNVIKRSWKRFRYRTMLPSQKIPSNPVFRAKMKRLMNSANSAYNKYYKKMRLALGPGINVPANLRTVKNNVHTQILRTRPRIN